MRFNLIEAGSALGAANTFASGKADLAVVRGDVGDLSQAQVVAIVAHATALLIAPAGTPISDLSDLKRGTIGVIAADMNWKIIQVLTDEYDLGRAGVTFRDLPPDDARRALDAREVRAVLVVVPLSEKYLALIRGFFRTKPKRRRYPFRSNRRGQLPARNGHSRASMFPKGSCGERHLSLPTI